MGRNEAAIAAGMLGFICVVVVIALVVTIFFLLTLQKALSRVSPRNRLMEPGLVWLSLIPLFNLVWLFFVVTRVPDSLRNEFRTRRQDDGSDYGKGIGLTYAILGVATLPLNVFSKISAEAALVLGMILLLAGIADIVLFIIFWVKIAGYSRQLGDHAFVPRGDDDYDRRDYPDDYDDRGPPPRGPELPPDAIRPDDRDRFRQ
ncbi:MAG: hypothetical protein HY040_23280 [Planctomycetes bacterium]|nr:hypothetical protein [Planctomycetota bacterium]